METLPVEEAAGWLAQFIGLAPERFSEFRQRYCPQCRRHGGLSGRDRLESCRAALCGLHDTDLFAVEQRRIETLARDLGHQLSRPQGPHLSQDLVDRLNAEIAATRSLTPGIVLAEGLPHDRLQPLNLRGRAQAELLRTIYAAGGMHHMNIHEAGSGEHARDTVRLRLLQRTEVMRDEAIVEAFDEDPAQSDRAIARRLDLDNATVTRVLKPRRKAYRSGVAD